MTKTANIKTGADKAPGAGTGFPSLAGLAPPEIGDALDANKAMMEEITAANHEIIAFVGKRLRADTEAFARLCRCRDLPEAMGVQVEFMSHMAEDYFTEMGRMMERAARVMEQGPVRGAEAKNKKK